jgi:hypothetical protein
MLQTITIPNRLDLHPGFLMIGPAGSKGRLVDEGLPLKKDRSGPVEDSELLKRIRVIIGDLHRQGKIPKDTDASSKVGRA